jgi:hypothetical protein
MKISLLNPCFRSFFKRSRRLSNVHSAFSNLICHVFVQGNPNALNPDGTASPVPSDPFGPPMAPGLPFNPMMSQSGFPPMPVDSFGGLPTIGGAVPGFGMMPGGAPAYGMPSTPSYGMPPYGAPSTPGYGMPPYGAPSTPGYGMTPYGAPSTPGYGMPNYGAPSMYNYGMPQLAS